MSFASSAHSLRARFEEYVEKQPKLAVALAATAIHGVLYMVPNHVQLVEPRQLPFTFIDSAVPFVPWTGYVYWSDYLLVFVAFASIATRGNTARFLYALLSAIVFSVIAHALFPVVYPRELFPIPSGTDPVTAFIFSRFREIDSPASCFPSLHVAASMIAAFAAWSESRRRGGVLMVWAIAVSLSTLTTKQHYLADVVAGAILAVTVAVAFYGRMLIHPAATPAHPSPSRG